MRGCVLLCVWAGLLCQFLGGEVEGERGPQLVYTRMMGPFDNIALPVASSSPLVDVVEFAERWIKVHCGGSDGVRYEVESIRQQELEYSAEGYEATKYQYQAYHEGRPVVRETTLLLGTNFDLDIRVSIPKEDENETCLNQIAQQVHKIRVFQDIDDILAITQHTWHTIQNDMNPAEIFPSFVSGNVSMDSTPANITSISTTRRFKVVSFNIWNLNTSWKDRLRMLEEQVGLEDPDVVGWQEVRYDWSRYRRRIHPREKEKKPEQFRKESMQGGLGRLQVEDMASIPKFRGYHFVYVPAMTYLDMHSRTNFHTDEGLAVFSRYPILNTTVRILSRDALDSQDDHQRICLRVLIDLPCCGLTNFLVTHLTLSDRARDRSVAEIWQFVEQLNAEAASHTPTVLMGDFNSLPDSSAVRYLVGTEQIQGQSGGFVDAWTTKHADAASEKLINGHSFPTWNPVKRIDLFLLNGQLDVEDIYLIGNTSLPELPEDERYAKLHRSVSSDHLGLAMWVSRK